MKLTLALLSLLIALAPVAPAQTVDAAKAAAEARGVPAAASQIAGDAIDKAKDKLGEMARKAADKPASTKSGLSVRKATNPDNPANWGKNDVHKLAVMDIEFAGNTETVMIELYPQDAPRTVANFADNCESGTYNGLAIHRAIDSYLVQTGDPYTSDDSKRNEWGTGGEEKSIPAEIKRPHRVGSIAMARRNDKVNPDRKSNGYQFYIALGNMSAVDGQYTVFGQVISGIEALQSLSHTPVDSNDCPLSRIEIKSLKVVDQKGPLIVMRETGAGGKKRFTKPSSAKSGIERFLSRIW